MTLEEFLTGIRAGKARVELCHTEDEPEAPCEQGEIISAWQDMEHWPADEDPEACMIVVEVDGAFRSGVYDDGLRELSVSQITKFLED
jgi:hypothetical protein